MFKKMETALLGVLSSVSFFIAMNAPAMVMSNADGFGNFRRGAESFFKDGLGGDGLQGLGTAMIFIGIFGTGAMFLWHKLNQQSPLPRPGTMVAIAIAGVMVRERDKVAGIIDWIGSSIYGWFGL